MLDHPLPQPLHPSEELIQWVRLDSWPQDSPVDQVEDGREFSASTPETPENRDFICNDPEAKQRPTDAPQADEHDPATPTDQPLSQQLGGVVPHEVTDDIDPPVEQRRLGVDAAAVERQVGSQLPSQLQLPWLDVEGDDVRAEQLGDLDGVQAEATSPDDHDGLARLDSGHSGERVEGREDGISRNRGFGVTDAVRDGHQRMRRHSHELGVPAIPRETDGLALETKVIPSDPAERALPTAGWAEDREAPPKQRPIGAWADLDHLASDLVSECQWGGNRNASQLVVDDVEVGVAQPSRPHAQQHLAWAR